MLKEHLHEFYMKFPSNQFHGIFTYTNFIEIVFKARFYKSISYTIHMEISTHAWIFSHQNIGSVRSDKLKPFWLSMVDEDLSTFNWLCGALMSRELTDEYREAVSRSLDIPDCKVVPFFGGFLRDLRSLFINVPSIIVLPSEENQSLEVNWYDVNIFLLWNPWF